MKKYLILFALILIQGCSSGGDNTTTPTPSSTPTPTPTPAPVTPVGLTVFNGGSLSGLEQLSQNLTFDELEIRGRLNLPSFSSTVITANKITITNTGSIGYSYDCSDSSNAPDISLISTGDVIVNGEIALEGNSGTRTDVTAPLFPPASCSRGCTGKDGGDISIVANNAVLSDRIRNNGGFGSVLILSSSVSTECANGDYGALSLTANNDMVLNNVDAVVGDTLINATGTFSMNPGYFISDKLDFQVGLTGDIYGRIGYDSLTESIGGLPDTGIPALNVITPVSGDTLDYSQYAITLSASDEEMGLDHVRVTGLNVGRYPFSTISQTYDLTIRGRDFVNGVATVKVSAPDFSLGDTLTFQAVDNKGNTSEIIVSGLSTNPNTEMEPNDSPATAQVLPIPYAIDGSAAKSDFGTSISLVDGINYGGTLQDWYKISGPLNLVSLHYNDTTSLELYIVDETGTQLLREPTSAISNYIELNGDVGNYYIVIQYDGLSSYTRENYTLIVN